MIRYLLNKPISVILIFISLLITGIILVNKIPISILPSIDVPQIVVKIYAQNYPAQAVENSILKKTRGALTNLKGLIDISSRAADHTGVINLEFEQGTKMDVAYLEVNEIIDKVSNSFPRNLPRPQVIRISTSDIPISRLHIIPYNKNNLAKTWEFTEKVIKKRLEQIDGVSTIDINGKVKQEIVVRPNNLALKALKINESDIIRIIQESNQDFNTLSVQDGQYRFFAKFANQIINLDEINNLSIKLISGVIVRLGSVATVQTELESPTGFHYLNDEKGVVLTIQKQNTARMTEVMRDITNCVQGFTKQYPDVKFTLTRDQSFLLDASIQNLNQDIIYGSILTILLLFLFLGSWRSPLLMSISIPGSLILTFILFYCFGITLNIISLSGLALGVGMIIDNAIVVVDNINRERQQNSLIPGIIIGTTQVIPAVISQVLTTIAVYLPLILIGGVGGILIYEQSVGLTLCLLVSLLNAFILIPVLYKILFKNKTQSQKDENTTFYLKVNKGYHKMITHIFQFRRIYFLITIILMPTGMILIPIMKTELLPKIENHEVVINIDWNDPITIYENEKRMILLQNNIKHLVESSEMDIGIQQFLLKKEYSFTESAEMYALCPTEKMRLELEREVTSWVHKNFNSAIIHISGATNPFNQLFNLNKPLLEARFKPLLKESSYYNYNNLESLLTPSWRIEKGYELEKQSSLSITLNNDAIDIYGFSKEEIIESIKQNLDASDITDLDQFGQRMSIRLKPGDMKYISERTAMIVNKSGISYPLNIFYSIIPENRAKYISADRSGEYKSIRFTDLGDNPKSRMNEIYNFAKKNNLAVGLTGNYLSGKESVNQMYLIFLIVLVLLFIILAIQYESLILPIIVMMTIPIGIFGGMICLFITGGTINLMSMIGFIVILGLIVDDPILKIETLQRIYKDNLTKGIEINESTILNMIHQAGDACLRPLLLVSLTTSVALVPVLIFGGMGNELQRPLAIVIIGGLTIGTFFTTWFIPLAYWYYLKYFKKVK